MPDSRKPEIYSIAAHRGFADALVAGVVPRYDDPESGLARLTLLVPSRRAQRVLSEAFIRHAGELGRTGILMPRLAVVGDLDLDETLGTLLDPLGAADIPPAVDPTRRWLFLADLITQEMGRHAPEGASRLRLARHMAQTMDRLLIEEVAPEELWGEAVLGLLGDLAEHWQRSLRVFAKVQVRWLAQLAEWGMVDAAQRRNLLFDYAAARWRADPPSTPLIAAGVTSAAPALARMLRVVADLPQGSVVLPDLDRAMRAEVWDELGAAGSTGETSEAGPFGRGDAVAHPQYHLKMLLNRMGVAREEVRAWHRRGQGAAPPERSRAVSALFLPPEASREWVNLPADGRRLQGVRTMETANPDAEAQAVALLVRQALEEPEKRVAIVTPDRSIARRVVQHLRRWDIQVDDSAGQPLARTPAGRLFLLLARVASEEAAPVPLLAMLGHPLVDGGIDRRDWLAATRELDLCLRGPRPAPGLQALRQRIADCADTRRRDSLLPWWDGVEEVLRSLFACACDDPGSLAEQVSCLAKVAERLCGLQIWAREDGRALSCFVEDLRLHADAAGTTIAPRELSTALRDAMECVAVRPPYFGHTRVAIYGLIEARMTRADLVICAGLNEGTWPANAASEALLPPAVLRVLGVPGPEYRIGLAAHDLVGALGAREVVLSRARRDQGGPAIPSRFLLRVRALLGEGAEDHEDRATPAVAETIDASAAAAPYPRPAPRPGAAQRDVPIAVTALDRLRGDPYQFYASAILRLRPLDRLDAQPTAAWQGELAHLMLERWHDARRADPAASLQSIASDTLKRMNAHPVLRGLWRPRLMAALRWVEQRIAAQEGRAPLAWEIKGETQVAGVRIHGRADRIDRLPAEGLAIVDYKTGKPPSGRMVEEGFALQLGLLGLIARAGGFAGVQGEPTVFEYWSLARSSASATGFGYVETPLAGEGKRRGIDPDTFLPDTEAYLREAIGRWIKGDEPFTARLNPDYPGYADYDQLMRLDEWQAISDAGPFEGAPTA